MKQQTDGEKVRVFFIVCVCFNTKHTRSSINGYQSSPIDDSAIDSILTLMVSLWFP